METFNKTEIKEKGNRKFITVIGVIIIGLLLSSIINDCSGGDVIPPRVVYDYKTDTVYIDRGYETKYQEAIKEVEKWKTAPPKTVIKWKEPDLRDVIIEKIPDSLLVIIEEQKERIAIQDNYIKLLPKNPKLVDISLKRDTLGLNLLNIDGRVNSYIYPIDLSIYEYKWLEGDLKYTRTSTKTTKTKNNNFKNLYLNGGYDFFTQSPTLDLEYFIQAGRFKFETSAGLRLKEVNANAKVGYRLLK